MDSQCFPESNAKSRSCVRAQDNPRANRPATYGERPLLGGSAHRGGLLGHFGRSDMNLFLPCQLHGTTGTYSKTGMVSVPPSRRSPNFSLTGRPTVTRLTSTFWLCNVSARGSNSSCAIFLTRIVPVSTGFTPPSASSCTATRTSSLRCSLLLENIILLT